MDKILSEYLLQLMMSGQSYTEISSVLHNEYPSIHMGLSELSIRRYVDKHGLNHKKRTVLQEAVQEATREVNVLD